MRALNAFLLFLACATPAFAQSVESFKPACGAEGDVVLIRGDGFPEEPTVDFNGSAADVIKSNATRILCRVPEGASSGVITVDGASSADSFTVVADGSPVILHMSASTATPGQSIIVIGRRLDDSTVDFLDADDNVVDTVSLKGRHRAGYFKVPEELAAGTYTLRLTNGDGADTGDCSPELEIVAAGETSIDSITPEGALPGQRVTIEGSDLGRLGSVQVTWTNGDQELNSFGLSNGFDKIHTFVPFKADFGATYDVGVGDAGTIEYTVGSLQAPVINALDPDAGPAGSIIRVRGTGLLVFGSFPKVEMTMGDTVLEAKVIGGHPGFGGQDEALLVRVPLDAADGAYDVSVTVGDQTSNTKVFTVGDRELTVTSMSPTSQGTSGTFNPVKIEGTGFGLFGSGEVTVTWDDGGDGAPRKGFIVFRTDSMLRVIPPGGRFDPLAAGTYTVRVSRGDSSVEAGTYTVE